MRRQRALEKREATAYSLVRLWLQGKEANMIGTEEEISATVARAKTILERILMYGTSR